MILRDFTFKQPTSGDFLVGYSEDGSQEFRTTVNALLSSYSASSIEIPFSLLSALSATTNIQTVANYLSTNNILLSSATIVNSISAAGSHIFEANSNNPALRITQTGGGHALVVEDDNSPDSTAFVISNNGTVVTGATAFPLTSPIHAALMVSVRNSNTARRCLDLRNHNNVSVAGWPELRFTRSRSGNANDFTQNANPLSANDALGSITFGSNSTANQTGAQMLAINKFQNQTGQISGGRLFFTTHSSLSNTLPTTLLLDEGRVVVGPVNSTAFIPEATFTVIGTISGDNLRTSFNQSSATGDWSFAEGSGKAFGNYSHAEGNNTTASGIGSHAEGEGTTASGTASHAEGEDTTASGTASHAEGTTALASGFGSHAEGGGTVSSRNYSHAEGELTTASGVASHAEGNSTTASGIASHSEGFSTLASGNYSHAEGWSNTASGSASHVEGWQTTASAVASHAEGFQTTASGIHSHAEGENTRASGQDAHAEGWQTEALALYSHAEGQRSSAVGIASHSQNQITRAFGVATHSQGGDTLAVGPYSSAEGLETATGEKVNFQNHSTNQLFSIFTFTPSNSAKFNYIVPGPNTLVPGFGVTDQVGDQLQFNATITNRSTTSGTITASLNIPIGGYNFVSGFLTTTNMATAAHSEGFRTMSFGNYSHTEGWSTIASGTASHAEGFLATAQGDRSHAEGWSTIASGTASHAEGFLATAIGGYSHAEGQQTTASGLQSHAEGSFTIASGQGSHAEGSGTIASGSFSHAEGISCRAIGGYSHAAGINSIALFDNSWIWRGMSSPSLLANPISSTRTGQFMVSTDGGIALIGNVGIGTDSIQNALTVNGTISTANHGSSLNWNEATTLVRSNSAQWAGQINLTNTTLTSVPLTLNLNSSLFMINNTVTTIINVMTDAVNSFSNGSQVNISRLGSGTVLVSAALGVNLRSADNKRELRVQNSTATVVKLSANEWLLFGDIV